MRRHHPLVSRLGLTAPSKLARLLPPTPSGIGAIFSGSGEHPVLQLRTMLTAFAALTP